MNYDMLDFTVANMFHKYGKSKAIDTASGYALNNAFGKNPAAEAFWKEVVEQLRTIQE